MNNEEKILKYFSDNLTKEEKITFEKEIENSEELKLEFEKMEKILSNLKNNSEAEVDDKYFINLMPNVRKRISKENKFITIPRLAIILPLVAVILITSFIINNSFNSGVSFSLNDNSEMLSEVLEEASVNQLSEYLDLNLTGGETDFAVLSNEIEVDEDNLINLGKSTLKSFDEYELINNLSEEEVGEIYNKLLKTKFL